MTNSYSKDEEEVDLMKETPPILFVKSLLSSLALYFLPFFRSIRNVIIILNRIQRNFFLGGGGGLRGTKIRFLRLNGR